MLNNESISFLNFVNLKFALERAKVEFSHTFIILDLNKCLEPLLGIEILKNLIIFSLKAYTND